jgi:hypothetical protein
VEEQILKDIAEELLKSERRCIAVQHARDQGLSEQHPCGLVREPRGTQRYLPTPRRDEDRLTQSMVALASQYGRYGYLRIAALLNRAGWKAQGRLWEFSLFAGTNQCCLFYCTASAMSSAGTPGAPTATTMYCLSFTMYVIGMPVSLPGSFISEMT